MYRIFLLLLSLQTAAPKGSHSFWLLGTYIKGQTPFPQFSYIFKLDDVTVLYYNGETKTFIPRGATTNESDVFDYNVLLTISDNIKHSFTEKLAVATQNVNKTDGVLAFQRLGLCELKENGEPGQMITRDAFRGSTTDELLYIDKNFTYHGTLNVPAQLLEFHLTISKWRHEHLYYPVCIKILKAYLEKRRNQVNRKVKPRVRIIQKPSLGYGRSQVTCMATGFYPRHINLTLFRDGRPVSDHELTTGDLLPNGDGTYQMRKILEISAEEQREKHKYTCTATHLSLDNKLHVSLEFNHGTPTTSVIFSVLTVFILVIGIVAALIIWRKRHAASKSEYSPSFTSEEHANRTS